MKSSRPTVQKNKQEVGHLSKNPTIATLQKACDYCALALRSLPETPVSAAGINVRYRYQELPDGVLDLLQARIDGVLSDAGYIFAGSSTKRSLVVEPGVVNLEITHQGVGGTLEFNFHKDSTAPDHLVAWLARVQEFGAFAERVLALMGAADVRAEIHA